MRLNWKIVRLAVGGTLVLLSSGCSGINASKSVSPATFFLPGLLQADPPAAHPDVLSPTQEPILQLTSS